MIKGFKYLPLVSHYVAHTFDSYISLCVVTNLKRGLRFGILILIIIRGL